MNIHSSRNDSFIEVSVWNSRSSYKWRIGYLQRIFFLSVDLVWGTTKGKAVVFSEGMRGILSKLPGSEVAAASKQLWRPDQNVRAHCRAVGMQVVLSPAFSIPQPTSCLEHLVRFGFVLEVGSQSAVQAPPPLEPGNFLIVLSLPPKSWGYRCVSLIWAYFVYPNSLLRFPSTERNLWRNVTLSLWMWPRTEAKCVGH